MFFVNIILIATTQSSLFTVRFPSEHSLCHVTCWSWFALYPRKFQEKKRDKPLQSTPIICHPRPHQPLILLAHL